MPHTTDNGLQIAINEAKKMKDSAVETIDIDSLYDTGYIEALETIIERLEAKELEQKEIDEYRCEKCGAEGQKFFCVNCDVMRDDGWISVSDRLPEEDGEVQVFIQKKDSIRNETQEVAYFSKFHKCFDLNPPIDGVTYWQPLHLPPKN